MILPQDINPEKSLYVLGSRIIKSINDSNKKVIDPKSLYYEFINQFQLKDLSYNYFLYALDWLFILGYIDLNENFKIKLCI